MKYRYRKLEHTILHDGATVTKIPTPVAIERELITRGRGSCGVFYLCKFQFFHLCKFQFDGSVTPEDGHLDLEQRFRLVNAFDLSGERHKRAGHNPHCVSQSEDPMFPF